MKLPAIKYKVPPRAPFSIARLNYRICGADPGVQARGRPRNNNEDEDQHARDRNAPPKPPAGAWDKDDARSYNRGGRQPVRV